MKHKIGILMVTITLLLIAFTMSVKADCSTGDLNGDKLVNQYDVTVVLNMAKGLEPVDLCADFDGDGFIGPADISLLTHKSKFEKNDSFIPELEESGIHGDVNNDKKMDYKDNGIMMEMAKGRVKPTKSADVDGDGFVGPGDMSIMTSYIKFGRVNGILGQAYYIDTTIPEEPFVYHLPHNSNCGKMTADLNNDYVIDELDEEPMVEMTKGLEKSSLCADLDLDGFIGPADISILRKTVKIDIPRYKITFEPNPELFNGECSPVIGDVNKDGKTDYQDIGLTVKMAKGHFPYSSCADLDKDGFAGPADISIMTAIAKGLPVHCSITNNCTNETVADSCDSYTLPSNPDCNGLTGDLNNDGIIDEFDIEVLQTMYVSQGQSSPCADLDGDGYAGPGDIVKLQITAIVDIPKCNITFEPNPDLFVNSYCECQVYGDVNLDGKANYQDAGLIQKMIVGTFPSSKCGDVDGDGYVSPGDISIAQSLAVGIDRIIPAQYLEQCPAWNNQTNDGNNTNETEPNPCDSYALPNNLACSGLTGDLNKDGVIDELDIEVIQKMIAGQETPDMCGDLDNDGVVAPGDYAELRLTVFGDIPRCNITFDISEITAQANATQCGLPGDVNHDGSINYQDIGIIQKIVAGAYPSTVWADLDGDGIPAPGDVAKARLIAAGAQSYPSVVCYGTNETDDTNQTNTTMSVLLTANPNSGKANLNVTFSCSVSDGTAPFSYKWLLTGPGVSKNWSTQINETSASMNYLLGKGTWKMTCTATDAENRTANSTKSIAVAANSTGNSGGGSGHSGGGSSRGGSAVFRVYPEIAENTTEPQPAANATVVKVAKTAPVVSKDTKNETATEAAIVAENTTASYKPSMWMIGAIIALVVASLGVTGVYISDTIRKKKAYA